MTRIPTLLCLGAAAAALAGCFGGGGGDNPAPVPADPLAAVVISLMILRLTLMLGREAVNVLLDETPVETQRLYAEAAGFPVATPLVDDYPANYGMITIDPPVIDNQAFGTLAPVTAAQIQYQPAADSNGKLGYDGHFVSTQNPSARTAIQKFLVTFMRDDAPTIEP